MKKFVFIKLFVFSCITFLVTGCLGGGVSAPKIPQNLNTPTVTTITKLNGVKIGLPKGWKNVEKMPKNYKETGGVVYLKHRRYGEIIIFKSPALSNAKYGKIFTRTIIETVLPDGKLVSGPMSLNHGAIVEVYKGTILVEGERHPMKMYTAYNISNGLGGKYYMHAAVSDTKKKEKVFYDFIAIADSL